jgi:hypothetical protein
MCEQEDKGRKLYYQIRGKVFLSKGNKYKNKFEDFMLTKPFYVRLGLYIAYVALVVVVGGVAGDFWHIVVGKKREKK